MPDFQAQYRKLNDAQRTAVDTIDGPLLVIAGPGTGKTQLLGARVANILRQPGVMPSNILCLTFTDNAARNMLSRLESMVGQPAYHVAIHTFHSFGDLIINRYPDFFAARPLLQRVDELGQYEILKTIFGNLDHDNPLSVKVGEDYLFLKDTLSLIGWLKHNALKPKELAELLTANKLFFKAANPLVSEIFSKTPAGKYHDEYIDLVGALEDLAGVGNSFGFALYASQAAGELQAACDATDPSGRYATAVTAWRQSWLEKDHQGKFVFKDSRAADRLDAVQAIYAEFQEAMASRGLYDFNDMIMEVVEALENNSELRLNLQEIYQYMLVDEFQDTNKAQLRILKALGDNPVNENRPNIMVVGDPNQAIYSFQGAATGNLLAFINSYRDVATINLSDNYRSTQNILDTSRELLRHNRPENTIQIDESLEQVARTNHSVDIIEHNVLTSELAQYQWIADSINKYLGQGISADNIAVIAPKHRFLERLMPYLATAKIPVAYERRENILEAPIIVQLVRMAELVSALVRQSHDQADALFGEVLNFGFWGLPAEDLIDISIEAYDKRSHWLPILIKHKNPDIKSTALWLNSLSKVATTEPLEYILDSLSGNENSIEDGFVSPFRQYYFSEERLNETTDDYLSHLGQLSTLRQKLRSWKPNSQLYTEDLVEFVRLHRQANIDIVDNNPHTQTTKAVQVMTAYKAKGLEFDVVFVINAQDEVWGPKARGRSDRIRIPKNLPIKPAGDNDEDKLRLFFVAVTRARHTLHITSYSHTLENKLSLGLSFVGGNSPDSDVIHDALKPKFVDKVAGPEAVQILSTDWAYRYRQVLADKPTLFQPILDNYRLSVTHLNNFLDVANAGPEHFLLHNLLRFPQAMSGPAAYGDAVHQTLKWLNTELRIRGALPGDAARDHYFSDLLNRKHLPDSEFRRYEKRGHQALSTYLAERSSQMSAEDILERDFSREGVTIGEARLTGKIDKLTVRGNMLKVIDFKTGKPSAGWDSRDEYEKRKLHKYRQQLMFYKLLINNSASYGQKFDLSDGALDFVETDDRGTLLPLLELKFDPEELSRFSRLIDIVWRKIMSLDFPDVSGYSSDLNGTKQFEADLLA